MEIEKKSLGDHREFIHRVVNEAQFYYTEEEWLYVVGKDTPDVVFIEIPKTPMKEVIQRVKIAIQTECENHRLAGIADQFQIRFVDGRGIKTENYRKPNLEEKAKALFELLRNRIWGVGLMNGNQYKSFKGQLKKEQIEATERYLKNLTDKKRTDISESLKEIGKAVLKEYEDYSQHFSVPERTDEYLCHIKNPKILGILDVKIN